MPLTRIVRKPTLSYFLVRMQKITFQDLSLSADIQQAIEDMGFIEASPIQAQAIPFLLEGRDVLDPSP
jgi:superfamily II DNA/RNA helicase